MKERLKVQQEYQYRQAAEKAELEIVYAIKSGFKRNGIAEVTNEHMANIARFCLEKEIVDTFYIACVVDEYCKNNSHVINSISLYELKDILKGS